MLILIRLLIQFMLVASVVLIMALLLYFLVRVFSGWGSGKKRKKVKQGALPDDAGVRELVAEGRVYEAEELYQRFTGVDKFTAEQAIRDIEREIRLGDPQLRDDIARLIKDDQKASAIEAYQTATGANLAEALEYVEELERRL